MAATQPRIRTRAASPPPLIGRDEMNLAEFPIALLADRVPEGQKTLYFEDGHGRLTVTGSDAYGLPTAADTDVIVALIYLTKLRKNFSDVKVNFSRYELIKLLNWPDEGKSYKRLDNRFNRWTAYCWYMINAGGTIRLKKYVSAKMHILESVDIRGAWRGNPRRAKRACPCPPSHGIKPSSKAARPTICGSLTSTSISPSKVPSPSVFTASSASDFTGKATGRLTCMKSPLSG